ncbi:phosphate ABC transporter permease PstA [Caulobacter sp. 17J65-9]|uniref:phosphate ABC transporter permease PstA n=1 Tax=Caulobacter sp. 17J65-9 TaxID=2709382 RepID=UPI0013C569E2|nr:phosphate ABC transporter permease PstA [Caulobacter sp. 17J65-9]NEX93034.1 phosphate ABC transporter permease PstA [Caulobacter sp. 17J65-9]
MTDAALTASAAAAGAPQGIRAAVERRLKKRHAAERRFRAYGLIAIAVAIAFLGVLLTRIVVQGHGAFMANSMEMQVRLDPARIDATDIQGANYDLIIADQMVAKLGIADPTGDKGMEMKDLLSTDLGFQALDKLRADPKLMGSTLTLSAPLGADADLYFKGEMRRSTPEGERTLNDSQLDMLDQMKAAGMIQQHFNWGLFTRGDSTHPEQAGLLGAVVGSAMMLLVTALLAVPIGVLAAVYLEEFAPKNPLTTFIEVNINNLAAVPSIVYGLLGLAVFIHWMGLPRGSPLVGGLVLALMALPTVIIATRSSLKAVPPSIREAALGVGASRTQAVFGHVLPLAMPGVMTGAILALAHALGETAPLLMIGMIAFVQGSPDSFLSSASTLPTQIFIWENASERAFHPLTAAAIIVLLVFMIVMNAAAIVLRRAFERRW